MKKLIKDMAKVGVRATGPVTLRIASAFKARRAIQFLSRFAAYRPAEVTFEMQPLTGDPIQGKLLTAPEGVRALPTPDHVKFRRDNLALNIWKHGIAQYESPTPKLFAKMAQSAKRIGVIGANSGLYVVIAGLANPSAEIVAVEPFGEALLWLKANVAANGLAGRVQLHPVAMGPEPGRATLLIPPNRFGGVESSATLVSSFRPEFERSHEVEVQKLDNLRSVEAPFQLVLIDVEAYEPEVPPRRSRIAHRGQAGHHIGGRSTPPAPMN